jgi:translation elongation factor EF-Ts
MINDKNLKNEVIIQPSIIIKLRQETGMGMLDCKKAYSDANGNYEKAKLILEDRKRYHWIFY